MATDSNPNSPNPNPGVGPPNNEAPTSDKGGMDRGKDDKKEKNPQPMNPDNPTVASTDGSKSILDSIKQVDGGNVSGFIKKAVDAMMQIRSIDGASGMGGGAGGGGGGGGGGGTQTQAAAMGKALINVRELLEAAQQLTLKQILDALNAIMPELIPQLSDEEISILNQAILAIITGTNVGVLSPLAVENAEATAAVIADVQALDDTSTNEDIISALLNATQVVGGPTLGLDPNSLAYNILNAAVGTTIVDELELNNHLVTVFVRIDSSYIRDQLAEMPTFTGTEQQDIATEEATIASNELYTLIVNGMLTADDFLRILRDMQANIQNKSLKNAIGSNMNDIMSNLMSIISQFAGNITDSKEDHQPRGRLETVTEALQKHSRILGLIKKKLDASDIFSGMGGSGGGMSQAMGMVSSMMSSLGGGGSAGGSAIAGSAISSALQSSDIVPMTSTVPELMQNILQAAQNPLQYLTPTVLNSLLSADNTMMNALSEIQVQSLLSALPPSLALSLMGKGMTMMSNLSTPEMNELLKYIPVGTVSQLFQGMPNILNYYSQQSTSAEQTSDIAAALAAVTATQDLDFFIKAILPNGTTVVCIVTGIAVDSTVVIPIL